MTSRFLQSGRWLIRDTFRQARASGLLWVMLSVSAVCILVCLSVGVSGPLSLKQDGEVVEFLPSGDPEAEKAKRSGVEIIRGELTLGFGAFHVPLGRDAGEAVRYIQMLLAGFIADTAGILLALVWSAGFLPSFLDPASSAVLFAKPVPRWWLLLGKYLGVLGFLLVQAVVFVLGTWLALAIRTGIWDPVYLLCLPLLLLHFAVFFSFSTFVAVCTRSTVASVIGSILFWLLCWGMNFGRHTMVVLESSNISPLLMSMVEVGYWILPKPADFGMILFDVLEAKKFFVQADAFRLVQNEGAFYPAWSLFSSALFACVLVGLAQWQLRETDF
ncbi:MAG: hypothetical protein KatS3mg105_2103 [Gemmatales bacterium]|nr:MAG: hypothetical protein KatS3mg105_2103 [Gemmatales bacterium]